MSVEEITQQTRHMDIVDDDEEDKTSEMDAERGTIFDCPIFINIFCR